MAALSGGAAYMKFAGQAGYQFLKLSPLDQYCKFRLNGLLWNCVYEIYGFPLYISASSLEHLGSRNVAIRY